MGRFNQIDPFTPNQQSGANLYAYCANDPVNQIDPSGLYGLDVHRYLTEFPAEAAGFDPDDAAKLGRYDVEVDVLYSPFLRHDNWYWHFPTPGNLTREASLIGPNDYQWTGYFLHMQQDSYAHCNAENYRNFDYSHWPGGDESGWVFGHAIHGHHPDFTWWRPEKAMLMADRVFADLNNIRNSTKGYDHPEQASWNVDPVQNGFDRDKVQRFINYPEYVTDGWKVTREGLRNKVEILGFTIPQDLASITNEFDRKRIEGYWDVQGRRPGAPIPSPKAAETIGVLPMAY